MKSRVCVICGREFTPAKKEHGDDLLTRLLAGADAPERRDNSD